jgi:hypothetical protein
MQGSTGRCPFTAFTLDLRGFLVPTPFSHLKLLKRVDAGGFLCHRSNPTGYHWRQEEEKRETPNHGCG